MSFAVTASVVGITAGVNSLTGGAITKGLGMGPSGAPNTSPGQSTQADPYGQYRPGDAALLQKYYNDPSMINNDPGFQAQQNAGMQATQRGLAATGQTQSGNEQIALNNYGQSSFNSYRQQMINNLMGSSGANSNPAGGVTATNGQNQLQYNQSSNGLSNIASGVGGLKGLFGNGGTSYNNLVNQYGSSNVYGGGNYNPTYIPPSAVDYVSDF